ncbi:RNA-directed DNA polymerase, eukaryota [Tanacetum coccineum]
MAEYLIRLIFKLTDRLSFCFLAYPSSTVSDYFIAIKGKWSSNGKNLLIISVYAPQKLSEKRMMWQYLNHMIDTWKGEVIVMGDFNEVRFQEERYGSIFNAQRAAAFNSFISLGGLVEVSLGGYFFTWSYKSATKMSKLDRFLILEDLMRSCPNISAITLDRYLSDHMPILLRKISFDYGPTPFRFYHYLFHIDGFDSFMADTWRDMVVTETNAMLKLLTKLKLLKMQIRTWVKVHKNKSQNQKTDLKKGLADIDSILDKGDGTSKIMEEHMNIIKQLAALDNIASMELAQKSKMRWSIEGDENSKSFHGIINKQRNNLAIRGILVDGSWIEDPKVVKNQFLSHFKERFNKPCSSHFTVGMDFPNKLSVDQINDLERPITKDEIKGAAWDCGSDKSPSPDGFTFGFFRRYWNFLEPDVVDAVNHFYVYGFFPKEGDLVNEVQSTFIANRQILDGPFILNELIQWCKAKKKQSMIFKVDFEKAFDYVRWDFLDDALKNFRFGDRWHSWIQSCLRSLRGSILINGSPTMEFQFHKGLKQGVSLDSSLKLTHLFYADDVVFVGQWCDSNINTIVHVLECFFRAFGLRINIHKSKLLGVAVENSKVELAAHNISCMTLNFPFSYLCVKASGRMSRINSSDETINKRLQRLSKWKMKTLSIGGRLTLLKSVLGSIPIYYMSMYKVSIQVLRKMESIRSHFFNGADPNTRKMALIKWDNEMDENTEVLDEGLGRRCPLKLRFSRGGIEQEQFAALLSCVEGLILPPIFDRWYWPLSGSGDYSVASGHEFEEVQVASSNSEAQFNEVIHIETHETASEEEAISQAQKEFPLLDTSVNEPSEENLEVLQEQITDSNTENFQIQETENDVSLNMNSVSSAEPDVVQVGDIEPKTPGSPAHATDTHSIDTNNVPDEVDDLDEIQDIDETLLVELDAVGDFSVNDLGSSSNDMKEDPRALEYDFETNRIADEDSYSNDLGSVSNETKPDPHTSEHDLETTHSVDEDSYSKEVGSTLYEETRGLEHDIETKSSGEQESDSKGLDSTLDEVKQDPTGSDHDLETQHSGNDDSYSKDLNSTLNEIKQDPQAFDHDLETERPGDEDFYSKDLASTLDERKQDPHTSEYDLETKRSIDEDSYTKDLESTFSEMRRDPQALEHRLETFYSVDDSFYSKHVESTLNEMNQDKHALEHDIKTNNSSEAEVKSQNEKETSNTEVEGASDAEASKRELINDANEALLPLETESSTPLAGSGSATVANHGTEKATSTSDTDKE